MLQHLLGNDQLKADLAAALAAGKLPHAILLCAMPGLGRNFAARAIAADYLYPNGGAGADRVMAGASEEVLLLAPEGAGNQIRVEAVRSVRSWIWESALMTDGKVVLVRDAQRMNQAAANALLKSIEEPPEGVVFLLTADSESSILPTIRSRCAVYTLAPVPLEICTKQLCQQQISVQDADFLCAVYGGALGSCLKSGSPKRLCALRQALTAANGAANRQAYPVLAATAPFLNKKEKDKAGLAQFLQDLQDLLGAAFGGGAVPGMQVSQEDAARMLLAVREARLELAANGSLKLLCALLAARLSGQLQP